MKKIFYPMLAVVLLASSAFMSVTSAPEWKIKDDYSIKFISDDPSGIFKTFKGTIKFDESDLAGSKFDLTIDVNSISTGNGMQNKKAMIEEWFNESKYPTITYVSTKIEKSGEGYSITGNLKMKGVSKSYKVPFNFKKVDNSGKFTGKFNVKRSDFKIGHAGGNVPDVMKIEFTVPVDKK
ncbi:MAG: YceI family protein [Flavobacteriia bacterium]|nr:YceI family protein [Flavobacteriia bacterium]